VAFDDPADDLLTNRLHSSVPQLIPQHFVISPLPDKILSFVEQVLRTTESSITQFSRRRTKTGIEPGDDGSDSARKQASWTRSCLTFPSKNVSSSFGPFLAPIRLHIGTSQVSFLEQLRKPWRERLSALLQAIWLRRFGTISNAAPFTSRTTPGSFPPSQPFSKPSTM
jgi:hypothetical protein